MMYKQGQKIYFEEEKNPYTIRACDERFLICTKPYNFKKDVVIYTIVDLKEGVRGTDGYSLSPYSYYSQKDCDDYLLELQEGARLEVENEEALRTGIPMTLDIGSGHVSYRNRIPLKIVKVK